MRPVCIDSIANLIDAINYALGSNNEYLSNIWYTCKTAGNWLENTDITKTTESTTAMHKPVHFNEMLYVSV